jgi:hypothetical protein
MLTGATGEPGAAQDGSAPRALQACAQARPCRIQLWAAGCRAVVPDRPAWPRPHAQPVRLSSLCPYKGGWPGGEVALWQLRAALVEEERERRETDRRRSAEASDGTGREVALPEARDGLALVYVGHGKR